MAYPCNFMCTCGPLWKTLKIIRDRISSIHSKLKGYTEENVRVSPIGEENDDESLRRVSNDTDIFLIRESDVVLPIESVKCSEFRQKNGYIKNGIAKTSYFYGTIQDFFFWLRRESKDLNHDEQSDGYLLNKRFLTATKKPESGFTKEDVEANLIELPSRDEIDEVLRNIRDFLFQGLFDQRPETQNEKMEQSEKEMLEKRITSLELEAKQSLGYKKEVNELKKEVDILNAKIDDLEQSLIKNDKELEQTLLQLGTLSVEHTKMLKENKMNEKALMKIQLKETSTQSVQTDLFELSYSQSSLPKSGLTVGAESVEKPDETIEEEPGAVGKSPISLVKVSKEESSEREGIRLGNVPTTAVERSLYNNYKFLLLIMSQRLLSSDVVKLKEWAEGTFSIDASRDEIDIFWKLDRQEIISASNLALLREFLVKILRIDLAHLIDCFMRGDYSLLRNTNSSFPRNGSGISNGRLASRSPNVSTAIVNPRREASHAWDGKSVDFSKPVEVKESFVVDQSALEASRVDYHSPVPPCRGENPSISQRNVRGVVVADGQAYNIDGARNRAVEQKEQGRTTESRTPVKSRAISHGSKPLYNIGSNGQKHSKFQREDSQRNSGHNPQDSDDDSDDDVNEQWLCNHYKRRCHVKFACCNKYWPCHRCHNNESNCGQRKLKSIHTKFVKCTKCSTEQEFSERSQFCINCHIKFAKYFCPTCKHLTGKDDKPYHCAKCGICRIHKHRSFHCDVCGVCLDVQLRDNHRCRAGSAHDECCICLEDAFSGCQILPCSHKVHKECATQMIRSGITCCPICRESFAHKLEKRRPARTDLRKHIGKY